MSIALSELWTRLVRSGLTDAEGCKAVAKKFAAANGGMPPNDASQVVKFLLANGQLTKYQSLALISEPERPIRVADYFILSDVSAAPFSRWLDAKTTQGNQRGRLINLAGGQADQEMADWLASHAAFHDDAFQPLEYQNSGGATLVFARLPKGCLLWDQFKAQLPLPSRSVCELGIYLASALQRLHDQQLTARLIRLDRIWVTDQQSHLILREPIQNPLQASRSNDLEWLDNLDVPSEYAAPELASENQSWNVSTDIYSLGCLLFRLATGRAPYAATTVDQLILSHRGDAPPELAAAIAAGESGDPLHRVLAYTLAINPASRFGTAAQLGAALQAVLPLVSHSPSPPLPTSKISESKAEFKRSADKSGERRQTIKSSKEIARQSIPEAPPQESPPRSPEPKRAPASPPRTAETQSGEPQASSAMTQGSESGPVSSSPVDDSSAGVAVGSPVGRSSDLPQVVADKNVVVGSPVRSPYGARRRKKKKKTTVLVLGGLCVVVLMLMIALIVQDPTQDTADRSPVRRPVPSVIPRVTNQPEASDLTETSPAQTQTSPFELVDDRRLLFVPSFASQTPAPLRFLPPGPAVLCSIRVADLMDQSQPGELVEALSPPLEALIESAEQRSKVPASSMSRLNVALHPGSAGRPQTSFAVTLSDPLPSEELLNKWQVAASRTRDGATVYAGDSGEGDVFYFDEADDGLVSQFAVGSLDRISEVAAAEGGEIPLATTMRKLWQQSSDEAQVVALVTPNFLFADGREMLQSLAPQAVAPLKSALIPDVAACLLMLDQREDRTYAELRFSPSGGISEALLMRNVRDLVGGWPMWADEFIIQSDPAPSWRLLAARMPSMMRFVKDQTRFGISDGAVMMNAYLPSKAVPQISAAALLALNTPMAAGEDSASVPAVSLSLEEMLDRKMSVSFEQESLEFAIEAILEGFKESIPRGSVLPRIQIVGSDLQLMGITQNQQIRDFQKVNIPLRAVLTDLVVGANPDETSTGPKDEKQSLVWVVADDPGSPGSQVILVTTRQSADGKYELPKEFIP